MFHKILFADCLSEDVSFTGSETSVSVLPYTNIACFIRFYLLVSNANYYRRCLHALILG